MKLSISDSVRRMTTNCQHSFQCLTGKREMCEVSIYIEGDGIFLKNAKYARCPYKQLAGKKAYYLCSCPTRIDLYKKFGV